MTRIANLARFAIAWAALVWFITLDVMALGVWLRYTVIGGPSLADAAAECAKVLICGGK